MWNCNDGNAHQFILRANENPFWHYLISDGRLKCIIIHVILYKNTDINAF
jgi:hypothetical protein